MKKSMGEIIKRLRKEHDFTQEELAELLGVTAQTISKWETNSGMPDVSQIVPLARIFGVHTDNLFDFCADEDDMTVIKIIETARNAPTLYTGYCLLTEAQKKFPNNIILLMELLERSIAIAYPENDCYDAEHAESVYKNSEKFFKLVLSFANNTSDILRARMIMLILHASYGEHAKAEEQLKYFPCRADMTQNNMQAYIAHACGNFKGEIEARKRELLYSYESMMDCMAGLGKAYLDNKEYNKALQTFSSALLNIKQIFSDEKYLPHLHRRDCGDIYYLLAKTSLAMNDASSALTWIEKLWEYDEAEAVNAKIAYKVKTPLFYNLPVNWYYPHKKSKGEIEMLISLLDDEHFKIFHNDGRYINLREKIASAIVKQ